MKTTILTSAPCSRASLAALTSNLETYAHQDVDILVLGFPGHRAESPLPANSSCSVREISTHEQLSLLSNFSADLARSLGHDSSVRTLAGLFQAWIDGAAAVVLWDGASPDPAQDFLGAHLRALAATEAVTLSSPTGWVNPYAFLETTNPFHAFPRGFPLEARSATRHQAPSRATASSLRVVAHAGLPLGNLDLDSVNRLEQNTSASRWTAAEAYFSLAPGTWCPLSASNFSLRREAIPAYFLCGRLHSYGAVWAGLLLQRISGHLGDALTFGAPFLPLGGDATDPWLDLDRERPGLRRTSELAHILRTLPLQGSTYGDCIQQIAAALPFAWPQGSLRGPQAWSGYEVDWRKRFLEGLKFWVEACEAAAAQSTGNLFAALESASAAKAEKVLA